MLRYVKSLDKEMMTDILRIKSNDRTSKSYYCQSKSLRDQNFTLKGYFVSR